MYLSFIKLIMITNYCSLCIYFHHYFINIPKDCKSLQAGPLYILLITVSQYPAQHLEQVRYSRNVCKMADLRITHLGEKKVGSSTELFRQTSFYCT